MRNKREINTKIDDLANSLEFIKSNISRKGFLGPTVREDRGLPSVGMRAARAAGVIVDDAGKMRCPPGTPNANQFTDLQMSNCMIPSAETAANMAQEAARNAAASVDRAIASINGSSGAADLPSTPHSKTEAIKSFNKSLLDRAPLFGKSSDKIVEEIKADGRFDGLKKPILTLSERRERRRRDMANHISDLRSMISSGRTTTNDGFPLDKIIAPEAQEFILAHTDEEVIEAIEQTALKVAKARKKEAQVIGKTQLLEKVLTEGYMPTADAMEGNDRTRTLTGARGLVETELGIPLDSGLRTVYGFSGYTFWDDAISKRLAELDQKKQTPGLRKSTHALTVGGRGTPIYGEESPATFAGEISGYGDMEFILHPEVADRTTVHYRDSLIETGRSALATGATDEELIEAYIGHLDKIDNNVNQFLRTHINGDLENWNRGQGGDGGLGPGGYTESQILGGFTADDIKVIRLDGTRLFPKYKNQFEPDGVDGRELIEKIETQHLSTEQLLAAGFTEAEIEVAREMISDWANSNSNFNGGRATASDVGHTELNNLIMGMEQERIMSMIAEKAPHIEVRFGSHDGRDMADPRSHGGQAGQSVVEVLSTKLRAQLLENVQDRMRWAARSTSDEDEIIA